MGKITIESENDELLNTILNDIASYLNNKQDNFKLNTEGFKINRD